MNNYGILVVRLLPDSRVKSTLDGKIYMNTAKFFSEIDADDVPRFDPHEYIDEARQLKSISIMNDKNEWVPIGGIINPLLRNYEKRPNVNLFCLHAIKNTDEYFLMIGIFNLATQL